MVGLYPILYWYIFTLLYGTWQLNPYYSHGILIPFISAFLILSIFVLHRHEISLTITYQGTILLILGLLTFTTGTITDNYVITGLTIPLSLYGFCIILLPDNKEDFLFPTLFLIFMIPIPQVEYLATYLAVWSAVAATIIASVTGISVIHSGATIVLPGTTLFVGAPCSGLNSILSFLVAGSLILYFLTFSKFKKLLFFLFLPVLAIISNIVRLYLIILISSMYGAESALDFFHSIYGALIPAFVFSLFFILLFLADRKKIM
jgi:exosortase